ncbi:hypothetical protein VNI00_015728 [Paramarasmius palmivorus]|uniref:Uncharacterized protein n=1 Tax=Paramarasmius palmivorus TaxID=297713 RepID=A0AAW0BIC3_9AGAR
MASSADPNLPSIPRPATPTPSSKERVDNPETELVRKKSQPKATAKRKGAPTKFSVDQVKTLDKLKEREYLPLWPDNKAMNKWLKGSMGRILEDDAFAGKLVINDTDTEDVWQKVSFNYARVARWSDSLDVKRIGNFFTNARDAKKRKQGKGTGEGTSTADPAPLPTTSRNTMRLAVKAFQKFASEVVDGKAAFKILKEKEIQEQVDEGTAFDDVADQLWEDEGDKQQYVEAAMRMQDLGKNQHDFILGAHDMLNACAQYGHLGKAAMMLLYMFPDGTGGRQHGVLNVKWDPTLPDMCDECPEEYQQLETLFFDYASRHVPVSDLSQESLIKKDENGRPRFPGVDTENTTPAGLRELVKEFFEALRRASGYEEPLPYALMNQYPSAFYDDTTFHPPTFHDPSDKSHDILPVIRYFTETSGDNSVHPFYLWTHNEIMTRLKALQDKSSSTTAEPQSNVGGDEASLPREASKGTVSDFPAGQDDAVAHTPPSLPTGDPACDGEDQQMDESSSSPTPLNHANHRAIEAPAEVPAGDDADPGSSDANAALAASNTSDDDSNPRPSSTPPSLDIDIDHGAQDKDEADEHPGPSSSSSTAAGMQQDEDPLNKDMHGDANADPAASSANDDTKVDGSGGHDKTQGHDGEGVADDTCEENVTDNLNGSEEEPVNKLTTTSATASPAGDGTTPAPAGPVTRKRAPPPPRTPRAPRVARISQKRHDQLNNQDSPEKRRQEKMLKRRHDTDVDNAVGDSTAGNKRKRRRGA